MFVLGVAGFLGVAPQAHAGVNDNVSGYAWSSTIGWISLNCTDPGTCATVDYGVKVDTTQSPTAGTMDGYAWSPHIGWISFRASDTANCPQTPCTPRIDLTTGAVTGFAKALAGSPSSGWDGWIRLGGNGFAMNPGTGVLTGFAWGSTVVGWVNFNAIVQLSPNQPVLSLVASQTQLPNPGTVDLTWTSLNVQPSSCSAPWTVATTASGTEAGVQVNQTTTFTITCTANNAPISASVTVTVVAATPLVLQANPMAVQSNNAFTDLSWSSPAQRQFTSCTISASPSTTSWSGSLPSSQVPNTTNGYTHTRQNVTVPSVANQSTVYSITCADPSTTSGSYTATATVTVYPPTPSVALSANPASLPQGGGTTNLSWATGNVTSCTASANPSGWSGTKNPTGGTDTLPVLTTTMYTIICQSPHTPPQVTASTTVYVAGTPLCSTCVPQPAPKPKFEEF